MMDASGTVPPMERDDFVGGITLYPGDCLAVLPALAENSLDSCVTDAPYHLTSIVKRFGAENAAPAKSNGATGAYARASAGFMGKAWDGGDIAFRPDVWREVYRVLKPGAYIVAFSSSRTYHRMACAIEDVGFITHPLVAWITGQGFPKARNVSKSIDKAAGAEREATGIEPRRPNPRAMNPNGAGERQNDAATRYDAAATDAARQWDGWYYGTQSLKPAIEPIYVGQKPFEKGLNGTQNILKWGTGALNVDGCRVPTEPRSTHARGNVRGEPGQIYGNGKGLPAAEFPSASSRWPANVILDGSEEVVGLFPETQSGSGGGGVTKAGLRGNTFEPQTPCNREGDSGSAARFFYQAKADAHDRIGSKHPCIKPLDLIQYLIRLVTPPGGTVLDCFAGSGTAGEAAFREGMRAVLIEREEEYIGDIRRRMRLLLAGPDERARESIKARNRDKPVDSGPLFQFEYDPAADLAGSLNDCYGAVKARVAAGGPGWPEEDNAAEPAS